MSQIIMHCFQPLDLHEITRQFIFQQCHLHRTILKRISSNTHDLKYTTVFKSSCSNALRTPFSLDQMSFHLSTGQLWWWQQVEGHITLSIHPLLTDYIMTFFLLCQWFQFLITFATIGSGYYSWILSIRYFSFPEILSKQMTIKGTKNNSENNQSSDQ